MGTTRTDFDIRRIGGRSGAAILGVDVNSDLGVFVTDINSALLEHKALVFRNQRRHLRAVPIASAMFSSPNSRALAQGPGPGRWRRRARSGSTAAASSPPEQGDLGLLGRFYPGRSTAGSVPANLYVQGRGARSSLDGARMYTDQVSAPYVEVGSRGGG